MHSTAIDSGEDLGEVSDRDAAVGAVWQAIRLMGDAWETVVCGPELTDDSLIAVWESAGREFEGAWANVGKHMRDALAHSGGKLPAHER